MIKSILIEREIERRLQQILTLDGYQTDAGLAVKRGWPEHYLDRDAQDYPILVIQPGKDGPSDGTGPSRKSSRTYRLIALTRDTEYPSEQLAQLLHDLRRALYRGDRTNNLGGLALSITEGPAEPEYDGDYAVIMLPVTVTYTEQYL